MRLLALFLILHGAAAFLRARAPVLRGEKARLWDRRRGGVDDPDLEGEPFYDGDDEDDAGRGRRRRVTSRRVRDTRLWQRPLLPSELGKALLAGAFVFGVGTGVTVDSAINTDPRDLASRDAIDRQAPNPNLCQRYGSSALALDSRVFVTFNPFSVYITQADVKPACVLRQSNISQVLGSRNLVSKEDFKNCRNSYNTWAYVGDIEDEPQLSCVYQSDDAQNEFLSNPKVGLGEDVYDKKRAKKAAESLQRSRSDIERAEKRLQEEMADLGKF